MKIFEGIAIFGILAGCVNGLIILCIYMGTLASDKLHDKVVAEIYKFMNPRVKYVKKEKNNNK